MKTGFIDWTGSGMAFYIFEKNGSGLTLTEKEFIPLEGNPEPSNLTTMVRAGIQNIHLSVPLDLLTLREQDFPFDDSTKISDTIAFELEGVLLGSTDDYSIDHIIIESDSNSSKVLAVCLEKKKLQGIIELFSAAGLDPKVITSLDIYISRGRTETLFEKELSDLDARAAAAAELIPAPPINLRQDDMAYTGDIKKLRKKMRFTAFLIMVLISILALTTSINLMAEKNRNKALTTETETLYKNIFPEDKRIIDLDRQLTGNMKRLEKKKAALMGVPALDILQTLAKQKGSGITLNEFNADASNIIIKGTAGSFKDVDSLKNDLSAVFERVKVMDSDAGVDSKINFTIMMQERDS